MGSSCSAKTNRVGSTALEKKEREMAAKMKERVEIRISTASFEGNVDKLPSQDFHTMKNKGRYNKRV